MTMKKTNDAYYVSPKTFADSTQAINKNTGEIIKITPVLRNLYDRLLNNYHYCKVNNNIYHESWGRMAAFIGVDEQTIQRRLVPLLKKIGLLEVKGRGNSSKKIVHDIVDITEWEFSNPAVEEFDKPENKQARAEAKADRFEQHQEKQKAKEDKQPSEPDKPALSGVQEPELPTFINERGEEDINFDTCIENNPLPENLQCKPEEVKQEPRPVIEEQTVYTQEELAEWDDEIPF